MIVRMQQRRGTASEWANINPILAEGEMGYEADSKKFKFGDGIRAWNSLEYAEAGIKGDTGPAGAPGGSDTSFSEYVIYPFSLTADALGDAALAPGHPLKVALDAKQKAMLVDPAGPLVRGGRCWILLATGQSNNTPADVGYNIAQPDARITEYTAATGIVQLPASRIELTAQLARELIRYIPPTDWICVVRAAVGQTCFTETTSIVDGATVTNSWDRTNTTATVNLYNRAKTWALAAASAATALGATPLYAAITFSGFEGDTPAMDEATFTSKLVSMFTQFRTDLGDGQIPVLIGSMVPEYADARGQTFTADIARALPKVPYNAGLSLAAFFYGPRSFAKTGEIIHYNSQGQVMRGKLALDALLRARSNRSATNASPPSGLRSVRSAGRFVMSWDPLWGRVTTLDAEFSRDNGKTWVAGTIDPDSRLFATVGVFPWENVRGRVRVSNSGAPSTPYDQRVSDWVYTDQYAATEAPPVGVTVMVLDTPSSVTVSPTHTGAASLYTAFKLPATGGAATVSARNADSSRTFALIAQQASTDIAQAKAGATTLTATFPAPKTVTGSHVNAATLKADGTTLKGYRGTDSVISTSDVGGDIAITTFLSAASGGATQLGAVLFLGVEHDAAAVARFQTIVADRYGISVAP